MKCKHCGAEIADDSVFCEFCGIKIQEAKISKSTWIIIGMTACAIVLGMILFSRNSSENAVSSSLEEDICYVDSVVDCEEEPAIEELVEYVYQQSEKVYCDGIYKEGHGMYINVPNLNRKHFSISFSFAPLLNKGKLSWTDVQYPLILGRSSRALGICLKSDGLIYITTNNHNNTFDTGIPYQIKNYNDITLEYNEGVVTINGKKLRVGDIDLSEGDLVLTSMCYSTGNAFKGYIKDLSVINVFP